MADTLEQIARKLTEAVLAAPTAAQADALILSALQSLARPSEEKAIQGLREGSSQPVREPEATPIHTCPICGPECRC
jgi:hypothetical protein